MKYFTAFYTAFLCIVLSLGIGTAAQAMLKSTTTTPNAIFSTSYFSNPQINYVKGSASLAQVNAGAVILAPVVGHTIYVLGFDLVATGTPATCTGVYLEDTAASPVIVATALVGALTSGAHDFQTIANVGPAFGAAGLTTSKGLNVIVDGSNCITMTSLSYSILYTVI